MYDFPFGHLIQSAASRLRSPSGVQDLGLIFAPIYIGRGPRSRSLHSGGLAFVRELGVLGEFKPESPWAVPTGKQTRRVTTSKRGWERCRWGVWESCKVRFAWTSGGNAIPGLDGLLDSGLRDFHGISLLGKHRNRPPALGMHAGPAPPCTRTPWPALCFFGAREHPPKARRQGCPGFTMKHLGWVVHCHFGH